MFVSFCCVSPWAGSFPLNQPHLPLQRDLQPQLPCRKFCGKPPSNGCHATCPATKCALHHLPMSMGLSSAAAPRAEGNAGGPSVQCLQCPMQPAFHTCALCYCLGWCFYVCKQPKYICSLKNGKYGLPCS